MEQNRPNFIQPTSRMTNYIVLRFGSNKPEHIVSLFCSCDQEIFVAFAVCLVICKKHFGDTCA